MKLYFIKILRKLKLLNLAKYIIFKFETVRSIKKWNNLKNTKIVLLELGSGIKKGSNGWTTVDMYGADITHDLRRGIPMPDNSVDKIYSSHMFEHISYKDLIVFINECYRVLKTDGELFVAVPNASLYINAYVNRTEFSLESMLYEPAIVRTGSFLDQVNYIAYMNGEHHYMFDEENLINTIKKAPFKFTVLRKFNSQLDLQSREYESIYALAKK